MVKQISNWMISVLWLLAGVLFGQASQLVFWAAWVYISLAVWMVVLAIAGIRAKHDVPPYGNPLGREY